MLVLYCDNNTILITFDVEYYSIAPNKTGVVVNVFNISWRAPVGAPYILIPGNKSLLRIGMPLPKFA